MKYDIYVNEIYIDGVTDQGVSTEKDGEIFKNYYNVWKAIYWNARGTGFIEHSAPTLDSLKDTIGKHAMENNYYLSIKPAN